MTSDSAVASAVSSSWVLPVRGRSRVAGGCVSASECGAGVLPGQPGGGGLPQCGEALGGLGEHGGAEERFGLAAAAVVVLVVGAASSTGGRFRQVDRAPAG